MGDMSFIIALTNKTEITVFFSPESNEIDV